MSTLKVNKIQSFSGDDIIFDGNFVPSSSKGGDLTLGTEANPWSELYVSTGSVNFVAPGTPAVSVAKIKAGGETNAGVGPFQGMIFTETNNLRGSFSVGRNNIASGTGSFTQGLANTASGFYAQAHGFGNKATANYSHAEGNATLANGALSHAEGINTFASGDYSHAEGTSTRTVAGIQGAHAEGYYTLASGTNSHAEGAYTTSSGTNSHAEGAQTIASGLSSHSEGISTIASGDYSHAEGLSTSASGMYSHAAGIYTTSSGIGSFTHGLSIEAPGYAQTVVGQYNTLGNSSSLFVVGAGVSVGSRKNGFSVEVDSTGNYGAHIVIPTNSTNPGNPKTGSMYFNPSSNLMFIYNGTAWRSSSFA